jgi:hypothetical protein
MLTPDKLNDLRKRVLANEPYTYQELAEAVKALISDRLSSFEKPAKSKSKATPVNLDDLI